MASAILDFPASPAARATGRTPGQRLAFAGPARVLTARDPAEVRGTLREVQAAAAGRWAVGFVAYEAAPAFDAALTTRPAVPGIPLVWFAIFDAPADALAAAPADALAGVPASPAAGTLAPLRWRTDTSRARYDAAIAAVRDGIVAGDVYQVNHTLRFRAEFDMPPRALYEQLVASRHGLYHALIETGDHAIISASPELFLDIDGDRITTRPMKGTMRRGRWLDEDADARQRLAASAKDRAENLMIVDLLRNDLGRIARFGSVTVPHAFDIETYPTVHQMTSTIAAVARPCLALDDIFAATFPCGSVTGAPKVTAMRAIAQLEDAARGVYCGAIGVLRPDGSATFNVAIRTVVVDLRTGTAEYGSGGGITWDSQADAEYDELVAKAALLTESIPRFLLIETMRMDGGTIPRLERHLHRLAASAEYWGFSSDCAARAAAELHQLCRSEADGSWRVRLTAAPDGAVHVTRTRLDEAAGLREDATPPRPVRMADRAVSRLDRLLFHKTTARAVYERHRAEHPDAFDVLLFNEEGEATEFTTGNLVVERDGVLLTPPRTCGLLAGCMRAELLDRGVVREAVVTLDAVRRADRIWLVNSVRGWVPVALADAHAAKSATNAAPATRPDEVKGRAP